MSIELPKLPEPSYPRGYVGLVKRDSYTIDQLRAYRQEALRLALEAAAVEADAWGLDDRIGAAIRALAS